MEEMSFVTTRKKRVSFLPTVVSTPIHYCHDSVESMDSGFQLVDAQVCVYVCACAVTCTCVFY